ncbi:MAG: alkene reductase [Deltaproteobacteria bacterium]|nr:alkene reductase [Deltaproteobacteria bacterium]
MADLSIFAPVTVGKMTLKNRTVMAPMTRSRAEGNVPNVLMAEYYSQRASAGLIVTEGTSPSPNGLGYARIPGIYSDKQVAEWKKVTDAVHARGGHIFVQLMHTGRVGHPLNVPAGAEVIAPSAIAAPGEMYTDQKGMQPHPVPRAMTEDDIAKTREEFVQAANNAIKAGFDGVELHAANGYLLEQFINPHSNQRTDGYGGSIDNRIRFVLEVATAVCDAIGGDRVGIRLSPYGVNAGMAQYDETDATHLALVTKLASTGMLYVHVVDHSAMGAPAVPESLKAALRKAWPRTFIASGGYDRETAEKAVREGKGDLVAFGRPFLSNPDLVTRLEKNLALNAPDFATFYTPGAKGYTDYPTHA